MQKAVGRGRPAELTDLQQAVVRMFSDISGYNLPRIARLFLPFVADVTIKTLEKRLTRLGLMEGGIVPSTVQPGTFVIHGIRIKFGKQEGILLLLFEQHSGWLRCELLPLGKDTAEHIVKNFKDMTSRKMRGTWKLRGRRIVIMTKTMTKRLPMTKVMTTETVATVDGSAPADLIARIKTHLGTHAVPIETRESYGNFPDKSLTLPLVNDFAQQNDNENQEADRKKRYERARLNTAIGELVKRYNNEIRPSYKSTRESTDKTDLLITPCERVLNALHKEWSENPHWKRSKPEMPISLDD